MFLCCAADPETLLQIEGCGPLGLCWRANADADYFAACARCEITVTITAEQHPLIVQPLGYDRRQRGNRGRCLTRPIPALGLEAGDRLEPGPGLRDIGDGFDQLTVFPATITFWRVGSETLARHRNPIFDEALHEWPAFVVDMK